MFASHGEAAQYINATLTRLIPGKVARLFQQVTPLAARSDTRMLPDAPKVDVGAKLRAMWDKVARPANWR